MKKTILLAFIFYLTVLSVSSLTFAQINSNYKWIHPTPQGNTLRWVKMWDANNWYAVGDGGTFMKTSDGGSAWKIQTLINGLDASGGSNRLYDAHFFNMNTGYACGDEGKVLKTTNGGTNWDTVTVVSLGISWLDMYWLDAVTGYLSGTSGIALTTNGGADWSLMGTVPAGTYYSVYAKDMNNVIAVSQTPGSIIKTTNGGTTWTTVSNGNSLNKVNFINANTGYVCGEASSVMTTTDFGDTWTNVNAGLPLSAFFDIDFLSLPAPPPFQYDFTPSAFPPAGWDTANSLGTIRWERSATSPRTPPACAWSNFQATGGINWLITKGIPVIPGDSLVFWLRRSYTGPAFTWDSLQVFISTVSQDTIAGTAELRIGVNALIDTAGNTYPPRPGNYKRYALSLAGYEGANTYISFRHSNLDGTGLRLDDIAVGENRPAMQTYVYLTGNSSNIYRAPEGTSGWDTVQFLAPAQLPTGVYYSTNLTASGDTLLTVGEYGLVNARYSPVNRIVYTAYIKAGTLYDIWAENAHGRVIAVGSPYDGGSVYDQVMYSTDGGKNWSVRNYSSVDVQDLNSISMINSLTGYTAGSEGAVSKTTDGGATWTPLGETGTRTALREVVFLDQNTGYVLGDDGNNHKTTNGGNTWNIYTSGHGTDDIYGASFINASTGWTAGENGKVYHTTDGGASATSQNANTGTSVIYDIQMLDSDTGWLSSESGMIRRTRNGGLSWDRIDVPFPVTIYSVSFADRFNGMASGTSGLVFRTRDGGDSWEYGNTSSGALYRVHMTSTDSAFICTSDAGIFKYSDLNTGIGTFTNTIPEKYILYQNYPNPFNPVTTIKFGLPRRSNVSLKIYDISGREVAVLFNNQSINPGELTHNFDGSALASGMYFYSLIVDNDIVDTKKMVLIK